MPRVRRRASALFFLATLVLPLVAGCGALRDLERGIVYQPRRAHAGPDVSDSVEGLERWWLQIEGGQVEAWYLPPTTPQEPGQRAPAVIFAHGNAELIDEWVEPLATYRAMGLAVLLPEYRSYGRSAGEPSEAAILGDFVHFYDRLVDRPEIDGGRVVLHGRSLGGGVVGQMIDRRRAAALVLESTFTNLPDLASRLWAPMGAVTDRFDTRAALSRSALSTLILHGVNDEVVPFTHAVELSRVAWDADVLAFEAGHNDVPRREAYWAAVRELLIDADILERSEGNALMTPSAGRAGL